MPEMADIIITNGRLLTMNPLNPKTEALAIQNDRILAVGAADEIAELRHPGTRVFDAAGNTVLPGFNESHIHIFGGSVELTHLSLFGLKGEEALRKAIVEHAASTPLDNLIMANSADYSLLGDRSVDRHVLDSILPDRPLALMSPDHHTVWANTRALRTAGLLEGRVLPPGNEIVMGPDGLATGELREHAAFDAVIALGSSGGRERLGLSTGGEPAPSPDALEMARDREALKKGLAHLAKHGITSFQNMDGNFYQLKLLKDLQLSGELTVRARIPFLYADGDVIEAMDKAEYMAAAYNSEWLSAGTVKVFMDGVLDSHTALMADDYADLAGWRGEARLDETTFNRLCIEADRRGLQMAVHAIGDGAVARALDGYEAAAAANGPRDSRHRIEHIEIIRSQDFDRFKRLRVLASMQPPHPPGQMGLPLEPTISRIGKAKWPLAYAWRTFRDAGVDMIFSSDWPVSPVNPLQSIHSAMTRKPWAEGLPDNRQSLAETLDAYTVRAAFAEFRDSWKGKLRAGYAADVVILDSDLEDTPTEIIDQISPIATICAGRVSFET